MLEDASSNLLTRSDGPHSMTAGSTIRQYCLEHDIFYGVTKSQPIRTDAHASEFCVEFVAWKVAPFCL